MTTLNHVAQRWHEMNAPGWKPGFARAVRYRLDTYVLPHLGDTEITKLRPHHVNAWLAGLTRADGEPMAASSKRLIKATLSGACSYAVAERIIDRNPVKGVKIAEPHVERKAAPDVEAIARTVRMTTDPHWKALVHLAAATGLRRGELCGLRWSDLDGATLSVVRNVTPKREIVAPKTQRSTRRMLLGKSSLALLETLREHRPYHTESSFIFSLDFDGAGPLRPDTVTQWWVRNRRDDNMVFHDLRHHAATQMLAAGISIPTVAERLGDTPEVVLNYYAHALPATDKQAADVLDKLLR